MREGKYHDGVRVGGVGQTVLVAGHGRVEYQLAIGGAGCCIGCAGVHGAICQDEFGRCARPARLPSRSVSGGVWGRWWSLSAVVGRPVVTSTAGSSRRLATTRR